MNITPINAMLLIVLIVSVLVGCFRLVEALRRGDTVSVRAVALPLSSVILLLLSKVCNLKAKHGMGGVQIWELISWMLLLCALPLMVAGLKARRGRG